MGFSNRNEARSENASRKVEKLEKLKFFKKVEKNKIARSKFYRDVSSKIGVGMFVILRFSLGTTIFPDVLPKRISTLTTLCVFFKNQ